MAKLLVNVRRKGRGFAASSLRKIANKLRKTPNRRTATNRSKVITREIRPSVITLEVKKTVGRSSKERRERKAKEGRARSSRHAVRLCEFPRAESSYYLPPSRTRRAPTVEDSITLRDNSNLRAFVGRLDPVRKRPCLPGLFLTFKNTRRVYSRFVNLSARPEIIRNHVHAGRVKNL